MSERLEQTCSEKSIAFDGAGETSLLLLVLYALAVLLQLLG